jgi:hypothetical protein
MGTNYYARENYCEHCQRGDELHIGKSSAGWHFALHIIPERDLIDLDSWTAFLTDTTVKRPIFDEYGSPVTFEELMKVITERSHKREDVPLGYANWRDFHRQNYSQAGLNGLVRCQLKNNCVGHGEGTWDYCIGEFC